MNIFADLHFHSKYSRAVSADMDLEHLSAGAKTKGLQLLGTGDFSHPLWFKELKAKLVASQHDGLYELKSEAKSENRVLFMLSNEVATFFSEGGKSRKVHHVLHAPSLEVVEQLNDLFAKRSNLAADGRPMFARTSCAELADICFSVSKDIVLVCAHAWTPWFGIFGSESGYDSLKEAFQEQSKNIFAIETGMSSDPAMNWRLSQLDSVSLMSNSDSHSPHPWRLGRECNCFEFSVEEGAGNEDKLSYDNLFKAVKEKDKNRFLFTIETDPSYGKYHFDGHRLCGFSSGPEETKRLKGICPVCHRPMTIGVLNRVEELADRPEGFVPEGVIPFKKLLPLHELVSAALGEGFYSKKVGAIAGKLYREFGNEFEVLLTASEESLSRAVDEKIAKIILLNREAKLFVKPGFDGEYGIAQIPDGLKLGEKKERAKLLPEKKGGEKQRGLADYF